MGQKNRMGIWQTSSLILGWNFSTCDIQNQLFQIIVGKWTYKRQYVYGFESFMFGPQYVNNDICDTNPASEGNASWYWGNAKTYTHSDGIWTFAADLFDAGDLASLGLLITYLHVHIMLRFYIFIDVFAKRKMWYDNVLGSDDSYGNIKSYFTTWGTRTCLVKIYLR